MSSFRVMTWNIKSSGTPSWSAGKIASQIKASGADIVALQESCSNRLGELHTALTSNGWNGDVSPGLLGGSAPGIWVWEAVPASASCGGGGSSFGIATISRFPTKNKWASFLTPASDEVRQLLRVEPQNLGVQVGFFNVQIAPDQGGQIQTAVGQINGYLAANPSARVVFAGDFQQDRLAPAMRPWLDGWSDADDRTPPLDTIKYPIAHKIDYIFRLNGQAVTTNSPTVPPIPIRPDSGWYTDHRPLVATVVVS